MKHICQDNLDKITALRHLLHSYPDLSLQESGTMSVLKDFLQENTTLEILDRDGWFYAEKRSSAEPAASPVAFRAEMDALPMDESITLSYGSVRSGVSHKCGHDGHMAALCGLALELDNMKVNRTVYLIFQPAEETGQGAARCAELIREKGISEIFAFHNISGYPENSIVYRSQLTQPASEGLIIRMHGKQSHASAPEEGCNPSAAIAELALYGQHLPEDPHEGMALCTIVGMQCGQSDFGISPGEGSISVTLRAEQEAFMKGMEKKFLQKAEELSARDSLRTEHEIHDYFPETRNHEDALNRVIRKAAGLQLPVIEMENLWRASEDFGYYLKQCPGAMFYIGNGKEHPALHTGGYDFNDRILKTAVDLFLALAEAE
ncbi:MAG: amidohydrolase [Oscillospiraceae bacterium]|nr:amidohydrolase [Oscillospiraceae bacterium]